MDLRGQEVPVTVESQSEIETESLRDAPRIGRVRAVRPKPVDRLRRVAEEVHLERCALTQDVHDIAVGAGGVALGCRIAEDLPSELEVVIAQPAVPEIADRSEQLVAADVELANARRAGDEVVAKVLVARRRCVVRVGPVEPVLADANLDEGRVPNTPI